MKQCFGYIRVSTVKQGEGVSLEAQKEAIQAYADQHQIEICQWFEEKVTAAKKGRPLFNSMIRQLKQRKADGLVIHKIDRSARNFADWAKIGDLADAGVDIHFTSESLDFHSRGGRLTADIQIVIAADYIRNLREETIKGINGRLKQGIYPFGAPIGFLNNGGGKVKTHDPVRAPFVKKLFQLYASGNHSIRSLQKEMDRLGLRNSRGKVVSICGIETVLNNPFYCGVIRIKTSGRVFDGKHKPLISAAMFEHVQDIKSGRYKKKVTKHNHTYRGMFKCRYCNYAMTPEKQKGHVYYRCPTPSCVTKTVREDVIESEVARFFSQTSIASNGLAFLMKEIGKWFDARNDDHAYAKSIDFQLSQINGRMERLTDALIDQVLDQDAFNTRKKSLLIEKAKFEKLRADIAKNQSDQYHVQQFLERIKNVVDTYGIANPEEKREFVGIATLNRTVACRNIYLEPSNWLQVAEKSIDAFSSAQHSYTSRSYSKLLNAQMEELIQVSRTKMKK